MSRTAVLVAVAALLVGGGPATPAHARSQTASHPASHQPSHQAEYAHQAFSTTNVVRTHDGLRKVRSDRCLQRAAFRQARRMAAQQAIFHQDVARLLGRCKMRLVGENVAAGFASGRSVVADGWMLSEGHRANLLNPAFAQMGLAARMGPDGRWYVAQVLGHRQ